MSNNPFVGTWSYRSLINNPDLSTAFNQLEFGRATLVIDHSSEETLQGKIGGSGWSLALKGARQYGTPMHARFQGTGTVGGEPWIYDYEAYLVPPWPNGVAQVPVMVGSVIRTIPHSGGAPGTVAPAGQVASFYAVRST